MTITSSSNWKNKSVWRYRKCKGKNFEDKLSKTRKLRIKKMHLKDRKNNDCQLPRFSNNIKISSHFLSKLKTNELPFLLQSMHFHLRSIVVNASSILRTIFPITFILQHLFFEWVFTLSCKFSINYKSIVIVSIAKMNDAFTSEIVILKLTLINSPIKKAISTLTMLLTILDLSYVVVTVLVINLSVSFNLIIIPLGFHLQSTALVIKNTFTIFETMSKISLEYL